jgi:phosphate transport system substrate-binding protein
MLDEVTRMKSNTSSLFAIAFCALTVYSAGASAQSVRIEGSSAGLTISQAAAAGFRLGHSNVAVTVGLSGSDGALRGLCRGEVDFAHSARPILKAEIEACRKADVPFIELPIAFDAVAVVVNPKNGFVQSLTLDELRSMWEESAQGKIVRWNQVNSRFPDAPLKLLAPDSQFDGSNYFLAAILKPGQSPRRDYMGSVDDNVLIQGVARDVNTVSYLPIATYLENRAKLRAVPIAASAEAQAVTPSPESIANGQYQPLSRPIFLYVNARSLARPEVAAFAEFYAAHAARLARDTKYVSLSDNTYQSGRERLRRRIAGSVWNGAVPVGLGLQELQKREAL